MSDIEKKEKEEHEGEQEQLTDTEHHEELNRMVERLWGLNTAIRGLDLESGLPNDLIVSGVYRLAEDVCEQMTACAEAFWAGRQIRLMKAACFH